SVGRWGGRGPRGGAPRAGGGPGLRAATRARGGGADAEVRAVRDGPRGLRQVGILRRDAGALPRRPSPVVQGDQPGSGGRDLCLRVLLRRPRPGVRGGCHGGDGPRAKWWPGVCDGVRHRQHVLAGRTAQRRHRRRLLHLRLPGADRAVLAPDSHAADCR
ncbi:unnamed protein product, partial [Prorocentrum cordatum]